MPGDRRVCRRVAKSPGRTLPRGAHARRSCPQSQPHPERGNHRDTRFLGSPANPSGCIRMRKAVLSRPSLLGPVCSGEAGSPASSQKCQRSIEARHPRAGPANQGRQICPAGTPNGSEQRLHRRFAVQLRRLLALQGRQPATDGPRCLGAGIRSGLVRSAFALPHCRRAHLR